MNFKKKNQIETQDPVDDLSERVLELELGCSHMPDLEKNCPLSPMYPGKGITMIQNIYPQNPPLPPAPPIPPSPTGTVPAGSFIAEIAAVYNETSAEVRKVFVGMVKDPSITLMIAKPTPEEFMLLALQLGREKFQHYIDLAKQEVQKGTSTPFEKKRELLLKARIMLPEEFAKFRAAVLEKYKFDSEEDKTGFLEALDNTRSISSDDFMEVLGMVKDSSITLKLKGENIKERILLAFMKLSAKQEEELLGMVKDSSIT